MQDSLLESLHKELHSLDFLGPLVPLKESGQIPTKSNIEAVLQLENSENNQAIGLTSAILVKYTRNAVPLRITGSFPNTALRLVVIR